MSIGSFNSYLHWRLQVFKVFKFIRRAIALSLVRILPNTLSFSFELYDLTVIYLYWRVEVAMKNSIGRKLWYQNPAIFAVAMRYRIVDTHSGFSALKYFDMRRYQIPHKAFQTAHCRNNPKPIYCGSFDSIKENHDVSLSDLNVKMSTVGEGSGRGLFAEVDIKRGSTIGVKDTRQPVYLDASSIDLVWIYLEIVDEISNVWNYVEGYGWESSITVSLET